MDDKSCNYTLFIPAAGVGSRLGAITNKISKALVTVGNKPLISRIIEQHPSKTPIVVALGHGGDLLAEYLSITYPDRKLKFVRVEPYDGPNASLGVSMLAAEKYLQSPFFFNACDTLLEKFKSFNFSHNFIVGWNGKETSRYRSISQINKRQLILDKDVIDAGENKILYAGVAFVLDYKFFWEEMKKASPDELAMGESFGLNALAKKYHCGIVKRKFFDAGYPAGLRVAHQHFLTDESANILDKDGESIWFTNGNVIKYFEDQICLSNRVKRAKMLKGFAPNLLRSSSNFYVYEYVPGDVLSSVVTPELFAVFLSSLKGLWQADFVSFQRPKDISKLCRQFYYVKTIERVKAFKEKYSEIDKVPSLNGKKIASIDTLLNSIDWSYVCNSTASRVHGDLHFENVIYDKATKKFTFIDWRQDFGGSISFGDRYYDLAKILHGLIVSHSVVRAAQFSVDQKIDNITFTIKRLDTLVDCESMFESWAAREGYFWPKIKIICALVFLNIAVLHHHNYDKFLFVLGKKMLDECLKTWPSELKNNLLTS